MQYSIYWHWKSCRGLINIYHMLTLIITFMMDHSWKTSISSKVFNWTCVNVIRRWRHHINVLYSVFLQKLINLIILYKTKDMQLDCACVNRMHQFIYQYNEACRPLIKFPRIKKKTFLMKKKLVYLIKTINSDCILHLKTTLDWTHEIRT